MMFWIHSSLWLMGSVGIGLGYFCALRRGAGMLIAGRRAGLWQVAALVGGRVVILGAVLTMAAMQGAGPLLAAALGLMIGRYVVMKGIF